MAQGTHFVHLKSNCLRFNPRSGVSRLDGKRPAGLLLLLDFNMVAQQIIPKMDIALIIPIGNFYCTTISLAASSIVNI